MSDSPAPPLKVLWLADDCPGHLGNARGVLAALERISPLQITQHNVRWRSSLVRSLVTRVGSAGSIAPLSWLLKDLSPDCDAKHNYDVVVAAGSRTLWPCAMLSKKWNIPNIFLGSLRKVSPSYFDVIAYIDPPSTQPPFLKTDLVPTRIHPQLVAAQAAEHLPEIQEPTWAVLVGGDGEGYRWQTADWEMLAQRVAAEAKTQSRRLLVATSRRTPPAAEAILRTCWLEQNLVAAADWYHASRQSPQSNQNRVPVAAMLGAAEHVIVTEDSVTMTHEAMASGKSVTTLQAIHSQATARLDAISKPLEQTGQLVRRRLDCQEPLVDPACYSFEVRDPLDRLAAQLQARLPQLLAPFKSQQATTHPANLKKAG